MLRTFDNIRYLSPRLAAGIFLYLLFFTPIRQLLYSVAAYFDLPYEYIGEFLILSSILVTWFLGSIFVSTGSRLAASLGFQAAQALSTELQLPDKGEAKPPENIITEFFYDSSKPLSGLQTARNRLESHVVGLRNTSILNLF